MLAGNLKWIVVFVKNAAELLGEKFSEEMRGKKFMVLQMIHDILSDNESNSIVQTNYIKFALIIIIILGDSFDAFAFHPEPLALLPLGTD
jgi:hypothetical protein